MNHDPLSQTLRQISSLLIILKLPYLWKMKVLLIFWFVVSRNWFMFHESPNLNSNPELAMILQHFYLKSSMELSTRLYFHVSFWTRNKTNLKIDIYLNHKFILAFPVSLSLHRNHPMICSAKGFYTMITMPISDTTFSI